MDRLVAILVTIGVSFLGITALVMQRRNYTSEANSQIFDFLTTSTNALTVVLAGGVIFVGGVALLFGIVKTFGGR